MSDAAPSSFSGVPRALMAAVIVMGVAIILGVTVLAVVLVHRMTAPRPAPPAPAIASAAPPVVDPSRLGSAASGTATMFSVPPNTHIRSAAARGDGTIAVVLSADNAVGDRIVIWNPASGRIEAGLQLQQTAP